MGKKITKKKINKRNLPKKKNHITKARKGTPKFLKNEKLIGFHHRIYRVINPDGTSESYNKAIHSGCRKQVDSIVHRFNCVVGFSMGDEEELDGNNLLMQLESGSII